MDRKRRDFIKAGALGAAALSMGNIAAAQKTSRVSDEQSAMNILILGGTGFIGPHMVEVGLRNRPVRETIHDLFAWWQSLPAERTTRVRGGMSAEAEAKFFGLWKKRNT